LSHFLTIFKKCHEQSFFNRNSQALTLYFGLFRNLWFSVRRQREVVSQSKSPIALGEETAPQRLASKFPQKRQSGPQCEGGRIDAVPVACRPADEHNSISAWAPLYAIPSPFLHSLPFFVPHQTLSQPTLLCPTPGSSLNQSPTCCNLKKDTKPVYILLSPLVNWK
jgi:hypothetical protein